MPTLVIVFDFDPLIRIGEASVRIATLLLAVVIGAALLVAARVALDTTARGYPASRDLTRGSALGSFAHRPSLRLDDLLFIVLGIVPGAVIGGRLDHVLSNLAFYQSHPEAILDPEMGSLGLGLAVAGGVLTGVVVARLLDAPAGRWAHVATLPTLLAIAGGRLAQVLGGAGQGQPSDASWATSYGGPGPWGSLASAVPSHPAQAYEGILTLIVLLVVAGLIAAGAFSRRDGRALALGIGLWAAVRFAVASTWRDEPVLASVNVGQVIALGIVIVSVLALMIVRPTDAGPADPGADDDPADGTAEVHWPDPGTRPRL